MNTSICYTCFFKVSSKTAFCALRSCNEGTKNVGRIKDVIMLIEEVAIFKLMLWMKTKPTGVSTINRSHKLRQGGPIQQQGIRQLSVEVLLEKRRMTPVFVTKTEVPNSI